jgi:hypothetical protein
MADQVKTLELIIQELQSRIGQMATNYETQIAVLKVQASQEIELLKSQINTAGEENGK